MLNAETLLTLLSRHADALGRPVQEFSLGGRVFDFNRRRALMGVINLSADSAYRESVCTTPEAAIARGRTLQEQGADWVDLGAESSLPDARRVTPGEQIDLLVPVVKALAREGAVVSAESYYPEVLEAAALAGARVFNLTGAREEKDAWKLAARHDTAVIHCHVQGETVRDVGDFALHGDMTEEWINQFRERIRRAEALGVRKHIVDPGLGFYYANLTDGEERINHQISTFLNAFRLAALGWPILNILPHAPEVFGESHRRSAEPFFAVLALLGGSHILRTHEVDTVARIRRIMEGYREPAP